MEDIDIVLVAYQFERQCQVESSCDAVNMWWNATSRMQNATVPCHQQREAKSKKLCDLRIAYMTSGEARLRDKRRGHEI